MSFCWGCSEQNVCECNTGGPKCLIEACNHLYGVIGLLTLVASLDQLVEYEMRVLKLLRSSSMYCKYF